MNVRFKYIKDGQPVDAWEEGASLALNYAVAPVLFVQNNWNYAVVDDKYLTHEYSEAQIAEAREIIALFEQKRQDIHGNTGYSLSMDEMKSVERLARLQAHALLPLRQGGEVPLYDAAMRVKNSADNVDGFNERINNFANSILEKLDNAAFLQALEIAFIELRAQINDRISQTFEQSDNPVFYDHANVDPAVKAEIIANKNRMIEEVAATGVTDNLAQSIAAYKNLQNYQVSF